MKKKLFLGLLAAAAVTFTACQKDEVINEVPQNEEISFSTFLGRDAQTKGSIMTLETENTTTLKETGFGVFAFLTEGDFTNSAKPNLMYNQEISWNDNDTQDTSDDIWDYSVKKYWPDGATQKVSFYAYAPYNKAPYNTQITGFSANTAGGVPTLDFTVPTTVSDQIDLLYATPAANYTQSSVTLTNNKVNLTFNHALSRIGFKAKTTEENENKNKVTVKSINISGNFTTSATINLSDGSIKGDPTKGSDTYELTIKHNPPTISAEATGTNAVSLTANEGYIMIIPTTEFYSTSKITITVNYDLQVYDTNISGNYSASVNKTETGTISGINFEKGKAYNIVLTVSPSDPIEFGVESVTDWSTTPVTEVPVTATPAL